MKLLIRGGRIIDPASKLDTVADLFIEDGKIAAIKNGIPKEDAAVVDASGLIVTPGFIDLHTHLREPGEEYKETIASGTRAAVAGGFTSVCPMANTKPVNDCASVTQYILCKAAEADFARVFPIGAITRGLEGQELAPMAEMKDAGIVAVSDDGRPVMNSQVMRHAMEYARDHGLVVIDHCQDNELAAGGVMNEGRYSTMLGLKGMSRMAEETQVARDLLIAELTGARIHIAHVSTERSISMIRQAKSRGIHVTCEATPHHIALDDSAVIGFDTNTKMNPPLRNGEDCLAMIEGLRDGTIDAIATDHAPHHADEKMLDFDHAPFGIIGLETALGVVLTELVHTGAISIERIIELLTYGPAKAFALPLGKLSAGCSADITLIDLNKEWKVDTEQFFSKSRNTPFAGWELRGKVVATFVGGREVYQDL